MYVNLVVSGFMLYYLFILVYECIVKVGYSLLLCSSVLFCDYLSIFFLIKVSLYMNQCNISKTFGSCKHLIANCLNFIKHDYVLQLMRMQETQCFLLSLYGSRAIITKLSSLPLCLQPLYFFNQAQFLKVIGIY